MKSSLVHGNNRLRIHEVHSCALLRYRESVSSCYVRVISLSSVYWNGGIHFLVNTFFFLFSPSILPSIIWLWALTQRWMIYSSQMIGEMKEKDNIFPLSTIVIIVTVYNKSYVLPSSHHLNIFIHLRYDKYLIMLQASNPSATKYKQKPPQFAVQLAVHLQNDY